MYCKLVLTFMFALTAASLAYGADAATLWSSKVQPIFDTHCVKCHGLIERKSGLELDTPEAVLKGGDEGAVVVPGKPEKSRLYQYLAGDSDPHMPPKKQLTDTQREAIREWIGSMATSSAKPEKRTKTSRRFDSVTQAGPAPKGTVAATVWDVIQDVLSSR